MGIWPFSSSSCSCTEVEYIEVEKKVPGNPNPHNFLVVEALELGEYTVTKIKYPDCGNIYQASKILLYKGVTKTQLQRADSLDPHFCDKGHISPIARFEPTDRGWQMAILLIAALERME